LGAGRNLGASTHGLGVAEAVALGDALGRLPRRLIIIGIEGRRFEVGADLSPEVARAVDEAVRLGLEEVANVCRAAR
jgi:hydrogenase maturation protease